VHVGESSSGRTADSESVWEGSNPSSPAISFFTAHSSSGPGRVPLKDEITGSNPVCATNRYFRPFFKLKSLEEGFIFTCLLLFSI